MDANLPPGVRISDIPGNRSEDLLYERILNDVYMLTVEDFICRFDDKTRQYIEVFVDALVEREVESALSARADILADRARDERMDK